MPDREGDLDAPPVQTCDGDYLTCAQARKTAHRYFVVGFFALPLFWAVNVWLFWPHAWGAGGDHEIKKATWRSAIAFTAYTCVLVPWMLVYWIGGPAVLGQATYDALDVANLDVASTGLAAG